MIKPSQVLKYKICVQLPKPIDGYWDGGKKDYFEFTPEKANFTSGPLAVKWGSFSANFWIAVDCVQDTVEKHLKSAVRKLRTTIRKTGVKITIETHDKNLRRG
jgi:hypothetical protein